MDNQTKITPETIARVTAAYGAGLTGQLFMGENEMESAAYALGAHVGKDESEQRDVAVSGKHVPKSRCQRQRHAMQNTRAADQVQAETHTDPRGEPHDADTTIGPQPRQQLADARNIRNGEHSSRSTGRVDGAGHIGFC